MNDMNLEVDKKIILHYHSARLAKYGQDVRALWGSTESQQIRFKMLSEMGDFNSKSILDVGCGFGDFYTFLKEQNVHPGKYVGIDMNPQMVAVAKGRLPQVTFRVKDILDSKLNEKFDYVVSSGIFPLETPNWQAITEEKIRSMYQLCKIGTGFNLLSSFTLGEKAADSHYANPLDILDFIFKNLTTRMVLRHDYMPNDFTIYIYKPFGEKDDDIAFKTNAR